MTDIDLSDLASARDGSSGLQRRAPFEHPSDDASSMVSRFGFRATSLSLSAMYSAKVPILSWLGFA